jgi:GNAT superfamily N-acetyltransferase
VKQRCALDGSFKVDPPDNVCSRTGECDHEPPDLKRKCQPDKREMRVVHFPDASSFLRRAQRWLMDAEAENNLILGICDQMLGSGQPAPDVYLATVEAADAVIACALRTPPHKVVITRGDSAALKCLVEDLATRYPTLPAVLGPEPEVVQFAELWGQRVGAAVRPGMRQLVFELREVQPLPWYVPGRLRLAEEADLPTVARWIEAFNLEAHVENSADPNTIARERTIQERLFVWEDGEVVSMAAQGSRTPSGAGVNLVYTPPDLRGRGYASACVAALSSRLLSAGHAYCCLFTDLSNPTSNSIYRRIGYRPLCEMSDFILEAS